MIPFSTFAMKQILKRLLTLFFFIKKKSFWLYDKWAERLLLQFDVGSVMFFLYLLLMTCKVCIGYCARNKLKEHNLYIFYASNNSKSSDNRGRFNAHC